MNTLKTAIRLLMLTAIGLCWGSQPNSVSSATSTSLDEIAITQEGSDTLIQWQSSAQNADALIDTMNIVDYGGYDLPMQLFTVHVSHNDAIEPTIVALESTQWAGTLQETEIEMPVLDDELAAYAALRPEPTLSLPTAPVFVLREGRMRDLRIAVIAVSPLYEEAGEVMVASGGQVRIDGVTLVEDREDAVQAAGVAGRLTTSTIQPVQPTNHLADNRVAKIIVTSAGIQEVTGEKIINAGFSIPDLSRLQLFYKGTQVALHIIDNDNDNILDSDDVIRFYADSIGDYWNQQSIYWLDFGISAGIRMGMHTPTSTDAPPRNIGIEKGFWEDNQHYTSLIAGADGDYWSAKQMQTEPTQVGNPSKYPSLDITFDARLPLASSGNSTFRMALSAYTAAEYTLELMVDGETLPAFIWDSREGKDPEGKFKQHWELETTTTTKGTEGQVRLIPDPNFSAGLVFDKIYWEQPVFLSFGGQGAAFSGIDGLWSYTLSALPSDHVLYDVTEPNAPIIIETGGGTNAVFEASSIADYIVSGSSTLFEPEVLAHFGITFASDDEADALYIAPADFLSAVQLLVNLRESQGYQVKLIDVQDIYDTWSYGHVSPNAIRDFLRFAVGSWNPTPTSVVLIGDGTEDPKNYLSKNNVNHIPPYMAEIDYWIKRTSCERCYAQLHGEDPLVTVLDPDFLTDIQIGRLPAKTANEASILVNKIVDYETATDLNAKWRSTSVFLADNFIERVTDTGLIIKNGAGNFAQFADDIIDSHPDEMSIKRVYYDPHPEISDSSGVESWRESDSTKALENTISILSQGAGLVTYIGAANHWQWAVTDTTKPDPRLLGINDIGHLDNIDKYFITLSMTSYTSQFQKPATIGTTLDERMILRPNGGAVATWGTSGLSHLAGTDHLQRGFHNTLWSTQPLTTRIGNLLDAGYDDVLKNAGSCCQDVRQTFLLLGDPLMRVLVSPFEANQQTPTSTPTASHSPTTTPAPTNAPTNAPTPTLTPTPSATSTPTLTPTVTPTNLPTPVDIPEQPPGTGADDAYEPDNDCASANPISSDDVSQTHTFHMIGDIDWITFTASTSGTYRIEITIPIGSLADVDLFLYTDCNDLPKRKFVETHAPGARLDITVDNPDTQYYIKVKNFDPLQFGSDVTYNFSVHKLPSETDEDGNIIIPGPAIIVAGRYRYGDPLQDNINQTAVDVYNLLTAKRRNDSEIFFLATDSSLPHFDAEATERNLEIGIRQWAKEQLEREYASQVLTLYLVDHGGPDEFYLDRPNEEVLTPNDLHDWLTALEEEFPDLLVNVFIEACNAGSFIAANDGSISKPGRVIITSSNENYDAYVSRRGTLFSDNFITFLWQEQNLAYSFQESRDIVQKFHHSQEPWIDADGDSIPNELNDMSQASLRSFAYAWSLGSEWPPYIANVQPIARPRSNATHFQAEVRHEFDNSAIDDVWGVVYPPNYSDTDVSPADGDGVLNDDTLDVIEFSAESEDANALFAGFYAGFTEKGLYHVVVHARDNKGLHAQPVTMEIDTTHRIFLPTVSR
ncbi:MAG: C25 family cysteine peptidase [Chloroflexota bacterium]